MESMLYKLLWYFTLNYFFKHVPRKMERHRDDSFSIVYDPALQDRIGMRYDFHHVRALIRQGHMPFGDIPQNSFPFSELLSEHAKSLLYRLSMSLNRF